MATPLSLFCLMPTTSPPSLVLLGVPKAEVVPQGPDDEDNVDVPPETVPLYRFPADSAELLQRLLLHHLAAGHPAPPGGVRDDARRLIASQMLRDRLAQEGKAETEAEAEAEAGKGKGGRSSSSKAPPPQQRGKGVAGISADRAAELIVSYREMQVREGGGGRGVRVIQAQSAWHADAGPTSRTRMPVISHEQAIILGRCPPPYLPPPPYSGCRPHQQ